MRDSDYYKFAKEDIDYVVDKLDKIVARLRQMSTMYADFIDSKKDDVR